MQNTLELLLLKDQQMVEAFLAYTPHEAFADGIGLWSMNRRFEQLAVVITDQIPGCLPIRRRFPERYGLPRHRSASE
jgi:hypothetical protein